MDYDVLVTGAGGFSGGYIAQHLARHGYKVIGLFRDEAHRLPGVQSISGDLSDDITKFLPPVKTIVHAAATSLGRPEDFARDNVQATMKLLQHAKRVQAQLIYMSTMSVYGAVEVDKVDPKTPCINPGPYGASKAFCEHMIEQTWEGAGAISLRLPAIVGHGAKRNWLAQLAEKARAGEEIAYHSAGALYNNVIHVETLCNFIESLVKRQLHGYDVLTLGSSGHVTVREVVDTIVTGLRSPSPVKTFPTAKPPFTISIEKAVAEYGYAPISTRGVLRKFLEDLQ